MSEALNNIISFDSLHKAHKKCRLDKRYKDEVISFELDLGANLWKLHYELKYGKYKTSGYHMFKIYDPKERVIQAITYRDRVVQRSLCDNYLTPLLEKHLIYDNCACRKNKGTSFAHKRLRLFMMRHYHQNKCDGYFVKIDVSKYFDSMNHDVLKELLSSLVKETDVLCLINTIIDSYNKDTNKGLPMGNQSSQAFALLYLDSFDRYFKERLRIKYYIRYMDDIIMIVNNKINAISVLSIAKTLLSDKQLIMNPKSQIIPLKQGIVFLGWMFNLNSNAGVIQQVSHSTKKRIINKLKLKYKKEINDSLVSYDGFLSNGNGYSFGKYLHSRFAN